MQHQKTVFINRPIAEVFDYMDDISREHEWQPNIREAYQKPTGPTTVGTKKTYVSEFMGKTVRNTYVTKVFEPAVHVQYETTRDSAVQGRAEIRWAQGDGGTRVTMSFEGRPKGVLRFVPEAMLSGLYLQELESTLKRLKQQLENGSD